MRLKSLMICNICNLMLSNTPITLPCTSSVCSEHLHDGTAIGGLIRCCECGQEFEVPSKGFPTNKIAFIVLAKDLHLNEKEKTLKHAIQELIQQLERLQLHLNKKYSDLERVSFDHFSELRRQIDLQRE